jgi:hypothetical protein
VDGEAMRVEDQILEDDESESGNQRGEQKTAIEDGAPEVARLAAVLALPQAVDHGDRRQAVEPVSLILGAHGGRRGGAEQQIVTQLVAREDAHEHPQRQREPHQVGRFEVRHLGVVDVRHDGGEHEHAPQRADLVEHFAGQPVEHPERRHRHREADQA